MIYRWYLIWVNDHNGQGVTDPRSRQFLDSYRIGSKSYADLFDDTLAFKPNGSLYFHIDYHGALMPGLLLHLDHLGSHRG